MFKSNNEYTKKATILIPYYNNSKTISMPLKSFLKLKYPHKLLKIIICDDCSNIEGEYEKLNEIVQEYRKHFDITVYQNKANVGLALNRAALFNHLLKEKDIEYFTFVDADDKLKPKFFNCCFNVQIKNDYKYDVVCAYNCKLNLNCFEKKLIKSLELDFWTMWGKLYKTSWYVQTNYTEKYANIAEDLMFWYKNMNIEKKIFITWKKLYIWVKNHNSMTKNKNKLNDNILDLYKNMENILKNKSYWFFKTFFKSQKKSVRNKLQNYFQSKGSEIYEDFKKALNTAI